MRAATRSRYGGPDVVTVAEVPRPVPGDGDVLVRVEAASVNRADLDLLYPYPGVTRLGLGLRRPRQPALGCDVAGVVEAVGSGVTRFRPGDRVFADLYPYGLGSFADYAVAPERAFHAIPDGMPSEDAATYPHAAILALQGLRRRDGRAVGPGDRVCIDGASGNVGPFAVQIAKALGAEVTGVASSSKLDLVQGLGADHVIDYTTTDITTAGQRYDWILAVEAHHAVLAYRHALRRGGRLVTMGGTGRRLVESITIGPVASAATGRPMGLMLWWKPFHEPDVDTLLAMYAAGTVRPVIDRRYPLTEVAQALRDVDEHRARGKILVVP